MHTTRPVVSRVLQVPQLEQFYQICLYRILGQARRRALPVGAISRVLHFAVVVPEVRYEYGSGFIRAPIEQPIG